MKQKSLIKSHQPRQIISSLELIKNRLVDMTTVMGMDMGTGMGIIIKTKEGMVPQESQAKKTTSS